MNYKKFLFVFTIIGIIYYILTNYVFINGGGSNATTPPSTSPPPTTAPVDPFFNGVTSLTAAFSNTSTPLPTQSPSPSTPPGPPAPSTSPGSSCSNQDLTIIIDNIDFSLDKNHNCNNDPNNDNAPTSYYVNILDSNGDVNQSYKDIQIFNSVTFDSNITPTPPKTFCIPIGYSLFLSQYPSGDKYFKKKNTVILSYNDLVSLIKNNPTKNSFNCQLCFHYNKPENVYIGTLLEKYPQ